MWLWEFELRTLGFRRLSERYWQCEGRFGLPECAHISVFPWVEQSLPGDRRKLPVLVELDTFHVTFVTPAGRIHFYYHDRLQNDWQPGGHTRAREIRRQGYRAHRLCAEADAVASEFVAALTGKFRQRVVR